MRRRVRVSSITGRVKHGSEIIFDQSGISNAVEPRPQGYTVAQASYGEPVLHVNGLNERAAIDKLQVSR